MNNLIALSLIFLFPILAKANFAVFLALEIDAKEFKNAGLTLGSPLTIAGTTIHRIKLGDHTIYLSPMGSGCLETSLHAQSLLQRFPCSSVYSLGPAATLETTIPIGSWHAVSEVMGWQVGSWTSTGFHPNSRARIPLATATWSLSSGTALLLASGDSFIADTSQRQFIRKATKASLLDMNIYGLARSCQEWKVPLYAWKIVSDHADSAASSDFQKFCTTYKGQGGRELAAYLKDLPIPISEPEAHPQIRRYLAPEGEP